MHVHDLNPKKTLVALTLFVVVIIIGFLTLKKPRFTYKLNLKESIAMLHDKEACFYPWQLADVIAKVDGNTVLIDIRDKFTFGQGHIPGAMNISAYDLTIKENIKLMNSFKEKGMNVVFYGDDQLQANGPWMWFRQTGYNNVKILLGGYQYYKAHKDHLAETKNDKSYLKCIPKYDYAKVAARGTSTAGQPASTTKKPVVVRRKKKAAVAAGGC